MTDTTVTAGIPREFAAAMAEIRQLRDLVDEITDDITRKSGTTSAYLLRKAASVRERAGLEARP
jgi:hypothetical protein